MWRLSGSREAQQLSLACIPGESIILVLLSPSSSLKPEALTDNYHIVKAPVSVLMEEMLGLLNGFQGYDCKYPSKGSPFYKTLLLSASSKGPQRLYAPMVPVLLVRRFGVSGLGAYGLGFEELLLGAWTFRS